MCSLMILMSEGVFACGCPKKSSAIVIVESGVLKMILYCSFSISLIFLLLGSRFLSWSWRGPIPALIVELFFYKFVEIFCVLLDSSNSSCFSWILSVFIIIFKLISISSIWSIAFTLAWLFVALCIFFCNFDHFLVVDLPFLGIWYFHGFFFGRTSFWKFIGRC